MDEADKKEMAIAAPTAEGAGGTQESTAAEVTETAADNGPCEENEEGDGAGGAGIDGTQEESAPTAEDTRTITEQQLAQAVAEAEQRGYLRGRNESIEALMETPAEEEPVEILQRQRMSIWDL